MRVFLLLFCFISTTTSASACSCGDYRGEQEAFEYYDFIGHVKVSAEVFPIGPGIAYDPGDNTKYIGFEALEVFKGDQIGWVEESGFATSCAMGISEGEEWVLFAKKGPNGNYHISYCTPSIKHRLASGLRNWDAYGANYPERLQESCWNITQPSPATSGRDTLRGYYQNGQLEHLTPFLQGKHHGQRQRFYPNGELAILDSFHLGLQTGQHLEWGDNGCLSEWATYNKTGERTYQFSKLRVENSWTETTYIPAQNTSTTVLMKPSGEQVVTSKRSLTKLEEKRYRVTGELVFHAKYDNGYEERIILDRRTDEEKHGF